MKIDKIYIGGWFQKTTLHFSEFLDFLRTGTTPLPLNPKKISELHSKLRVASIKYHVEGMEYLEGTTTDDIHFKVFEDGLVVFDRKHEHENRANIAEHFKVLTDYFEQCMSPALAYLFSMGAPTPREVAEIETIYPFFVVLDNSTLPEMKQLLADFHETEHFEVSNQHFDILRGNKLYIINSKTEKLSQVRHFIEEQIFLREFKGRLHHYLNLHRHIWQLIDQTKGRGKIRGKQIADFHSKIESYGKTVNLSDTRIRQMGTYLRTREQLAHKDNATKDFKDLIEFRYESMYDTQQYVIAVWDMTAKYVNDAKEQFSSIQSDMTEKSIEGLTIVTSMGVGGTLIGLITAEQPEFTVFGIIWAALIAGVGFLATRILKWSASRKNYDVSDTERATGISADEILSRKRTRDR